jgi:hypothetical protein
LEVQTAWQEIEDDICAGLLTRRMGLWHRVLREAERIAQEHTPDVGCRTLDVIQIAAAVIMAATEFCTFDMRQAELGRRLGLTVIIP